MSTEQSASITALLHLVVRHPHIFVIVLVLCIAMRVLSSVCFAGPGKR